MDNEKSSINNKATITTSCQVCSSDTTLLTDGSCSKKCSPGTYQKPYNNVCEACPFKNCLECPLGETCTRCETLYKPAVSAEATSSAADNGQCVSACGEGTYQNHAAKECTKCHNLCLKCKGSTKHDCSQCRKKALTLLKRDKRTSCVLECPVGYFKQNSLCLPCDAKCATCETSDKCLSCNEPYMLEKDSCVAECSNAHYQDPKLNQCIPCSIYLNCSECSLLGGCTQCKPGAYFLNNVCINECGPGFYAHGKHCVQCSVDHEHCAACVQDKCLKCKQGYEMSAKSNTCLIVKSTTTITTTTTSTATTPTTTNATAATATNNTTTATATQTTVNGVDPTDNTTSTTLKTLNDNTTLTENVTLTTINVTATKLTTTNISSFNINNGSSPQTVPIAVSSGDDAIIVNLNETAKMNNESVILTSTAKPEGNSSSTSQRQTTGLAEQLVTSRLKTDIEEVTGDGVPTTDNNATTTSVTPIIVVDKEVNENTEASKIVINFDDDSDHFIGKDKEEKNMEEDGGKGDGAADSVKDDVTTSVKDDSPQVEQIQRDFVPVNKKVSPAALPANAHNTQEDQIRDDEEDDEGSTFIDPLSEVYTIPKNSNSNKKPPKSISGGVSASKKFLEVLGEADEDDVNAALHHGKNLFAGESLLGESPSSNKKEIENALLLTGETLQGESSSPSALKTGEDEMLNKTSSENLISKQLTVDPDLQPKKRSRRSLDAEAVVQSEEISTRTPRKMNSSLITTPIACVVIIIAGVVVIVGIATLNKRRRRNNIGSVE